jgi:integrase
MSDAAGLPKVDLLKGRFHIFRRLNSAYWWVGFHHKGKYIRQSTKEKEQQPAETIAERWYFEKQFQLQNGKLITSTKTFGSATKRALERYADAVKRGERSERTLESIIGVLNSRVLPFFERKPIESITNQTWFEFKEEMYTTYPDIRRGTLHQYKNALRVVLNDAYQAGIIQNLPVFKDTYKSSRIESPRPWFTFKEYNKLLVNIRSHITHLKKTKPRWVEGAEELYDYVIFGTNTGMRVSEMSNVRFCDIEIKSEQRKRYLIIRNIKGKRGTGTCKSYYGAVSAFERLAKRRNIKNSNSSEELLFPTHHRDMFNEVLKKADLKYSKTQPPAKRDFVSLRATYICFRLLNNADIFDIATNCRTSPEIIKESYAKYLGGEMMKNINKTNEKVDGWDA